MQNYKLLNKEFKHLILLKSNIFLYIFALELKLYLLYIFLFYFVLVFLLLLFNLKKLGLNWKNYYYFF